MVQEDEDYFYSSCATSPEFQHPPPPPSDISIACLQKLLQGSLITFSLAITSWTKYHPHHWMSSIQNICKWCKFSWHRHGTFSTWYYTQDQLIGHGNCSDVYWNSNPIVIPSMQSISEDLQSWRNGFSLKTDVYLQKLAILIFNCYPWQLKYWTVSTMCNLVTAYERFNDSLTTT